MFYAPTGYAHRGDELDPAILDRPTSSSSRRTEALRRDRYEPGRKVVGYTVWETSRIPSHWLPLLNLPDHLIVPCNWNKAVFEQCGVRTPIVVVPHIAEAPSLAEAGRSSAAPPGDFVFYTIGTWTYRKAIWSTVAAYCEAFSGDDPTMLVIKTSARDFTRAGFWRFHPRSARSLARLVRRYRNPQESR